MTSFEVRGLKMRPGGYGFRATALRVDGPWHIFVSYEGSDKHLSFIELQELPNGIEVAERIEDKVVRLIELIGLTWEEILTDPLLAIDWQTRLVEQMPSGMENRMENTPLEEIADWREQMETVTAGEYLRADLTGDDPLSLRN